MPAHFKDVKKLHFVKFTLCVNLNICRHNNDAPLNGTSFLGSREGSIRFVNFKHK